MKLYKLLLIIAILTVITLFFLLLPGFIAAPLPVYGGELSIKEAGNLQTLLKKTTDRKIEEIIIRDDKQHCLVIEHEGIPNFRLEKKWGRWHLTSKNKSSYLSGVSEIYLQTNSKTAGVYHLRAVNQVNFYSAYDLVKSKIAFIPSENTYYREGVISDPLELTIQDVATGSVLFIYTDGKEIWHSNNQEDFITVPEKDIFPKNKPKDMNGSLAAVWEQPPELSARMIYGILTASVDEAPTLALFIDGLGYKLWNYSQDKGYTDTFPDLKMKAMRTVYPPRTIYNYYTFGTGELLQDSDPEDRKIFPNFGKNNNKQIIIEGEMQLYDSFVKQQLHPRQQRDADIDHLILGSTLEYMEDYHFIFVHFHDIDDTGHRYGPYSIQVMERIRRTGEYVSEIYKNWDGNLFLFSDHGMHEIYDQESGNVTGSHYTAQAEDIIALFAELKNN